MWQRTAVRLAMRFPQLSQFNALFGLAVILLVVASPSSSRAQNSSSGANASQVQQGEYLARAGDCVACHTAPTGPLFADDFYRVMHVGRMPDDSLLYPAMPFPSYTKVTRADSDAIFAYLKTVPAVHQPDRPTDLRFPFNNRSLVIGWRTLFFNEGEYTPDPHQSAEWNRGAYLVEGLGHCGMCHTPINALGGSSERQAFQGGLIPLQNWYAPSLTSNKEAGLGDWSID